MIDINLMISGKTASKKRNVICQSFKIMKMKNMLYTLSGIYNEKYIGLSNIEYKSFSNFTWAIEVSKHLILLGDEFLVAKGTVLDKNLDYHFITIINAPISIRDLNSIQIKPFVKIYISSELFLHPKIKKYLDSIFELNVEVMSKEKLNEMVLLENKSNVDIFEMLDDEKPRLKGIF